LYCFDQSCIASPILATATAFAIVPPSPCLLTVQGKLAARCALPLKRQGVSMTDISAVLDRADQNLSDSIERLFSLVRIQSISTDPAYKAECRKAAEWLVTELKGIGFDASVRDTAGHPMVVAHHDAATADAPHILFYGHYDVQPVDPIELWEDSPFEPKIKELSPGRKVLTGRGTADD
jgi:acetylornithine deacetylase/succinyl-diaminopimelate desuccinylase-like protein